MAEAISGWSRGEAIGRPLPEVFAITTADGPDETLELLHRAMMEEVTITLGEGRFLRTQDGRMVPVDDSLAPIRDDQGFTTGCVVIFRDNTTQVEADQARRELEEKMQEAQRLESLGVLASGIAHDFNNLLTAVTCNASLSRITNPGNLPLVESMEAIEEAAERASILCRQMLDYAGKNQVKLQNFDLSAFTRDTTQLLQVAISKNAGLRFDLEENLPPCCADISQIQQVIMNLVINGSEALGGLPGTIEVRTRRFQATRAFLSTCRTGAQLDEGEYLLLEVSDTGSGMTPEVLSRIFDPFFTTKFTGRGLGLAAISGIVRTHGGALAVQSAPGQGSVFQVILPIAKTAAPPAQVPAPHAAWRGSGRVLFVDDELAIRLAGSALIRRLGFAVETAQDGQEGVEKALAAGADYVIVMLDLTMPKLDGHAAFRAIRAQQPTQPILLMSGYSSQQVASLFQSETPVSFLQKPFTLASLIAALRPLLSHQPGA
jgi:PAS domain S-box-containing protein